VRRLRAHALNAVASPPTNRWMYKRDRMRFGMLVSILALVGRPRKREADAWLL